MAAQQSSWASRARETLRSNATFAALGSLLLWLVAWPFLWASRLWRSRQKVAAGLVGAIGALVFYPGVGFGAWQLTSGTEEIAAVAPTATPTDTPSGTSTPAIPHVPGLSMPSYWEVDDQDSVEIKGRTEPRARVRLRGVGGLFRETADEQGNFAITVRPLPIGETTLTLQVLKEGFDIRTTELTVMRRISEQAFKAQARSIPYDELKKDPDALAGEIVVYRAEVFQYDARTGTSEMIVSVTPAGYGFWEDSVYLYLDPALASEVDEEDIIRFWGTVDGAITYETATRGSNTLPSVEVEYLALLEKR